jgi:inosose dehydratase
MPVRLGISPIGWSNDDLPQLGSDTPLASCLAEARAAGYEGIELGHKFPSRSRGIAAYPGTGRAGADLGVV